MLEYESIPGVVSTLRRFKNEQVKRSSEEIITVKDITNKVCLSLDMHFSFVFIEVSCYCFDAVCGILQAWGDLQYFFANTKSRNPA